MFCLRVLKTALAGIAAAVLITPLSTSLAKAQTSQTTPFIHDLKNERQLTNLFKESGFGYSIGYPEDWIYTKPSQYTVIFSGKEGTEGYYSTVTIQNLASTKIGGKYTDLGSVVNDLKHQLQRGALNTKIYDEHPFIYEKEGLRLEGRELKAEYLRQGENFRQWVIAVPRSTGDIFHAWSYTSPVNQYNTYLKTADVMLRSWEIGEPTPIEDKLKSILWNTNATDKRGKRGQRFIYSCPPGGKSYHVWGTDVYDVESSICTAAVHAGLITFQTGGTVTIEIRPASSSYRSTRNGVSTIDNVYNPSTIERADSFVFVSQTEILSTLEKPHHVQRPEVGIRFVHPKLGFSLVIPDGWREKEKKTAGGEIELEAVDGLAQFFVNVEEHVKRALMVNVQDFEKEIVGEGKSFQKKLKGREFVLNGAEAYEGVYEDKDGIATKIVFVKKAERVYMLHGHCMASEFSRFETIFDKIVASFRVIEPSIPAEKLAPIVEEPKVRETVEDFTFGK